MDYEIGKKRYDEEIDLSKYSVDYLLGIYGIKPQMVDSMRSSGINTLDQVASLKDFNDVDHSQIKAIEFAIQELMINEGFIPNNS